MIALDNLFALWGLSLLIALVVLFVVGFLLHRILRSVGHIETVAGDIWTVGKNIANNTVHIPLLATTNRVVASIHGHALGVVQQVERIHHHARECPGCPDCVLERTHRE